MKDVMLDLETMGTSPGSVIVSLGAAEFDIEKKEIGKTFYATIDMQSCINVGLHVDAGAVEFWLRQDDAARSALLANTKPLGEVLHAFVRWFPNKARPWGNGASFDLALLRAAYEACLYKAPWNYRDEMCFRTLRSLNPGTPWPEFVGVKHNALDDAVQQIKFLFNMTRTSP